MQKRMIPMILVVALLFSGLFSIVSIHGLQGNARVINYAGVVRGATQRLIKQELSDQPNDALIARLDGILQDLAAGGGENSLVRLEDYPFQNLISQMRESWGNLKLEISRVRQGADKNELYEMSERYFDLADHTVSAAEAYTERQVIQAEQSLMVLSAVFLLLAGLLGWYGSLQDKRQKKLQADEDANRTRSEYLSRMSEDLRAPLNDLSELMYVADLENYDLLFINEAGRRTFGLDEIAGKKCYRVLQGREQPCEFCTSPELVPGETHTWEYTNPLIGRHYLLKDRLLEWEGRPARLEIAFDITAAETEKQALKSMLDAQQMLMECVRALYQEHDLKLALPSVMEQMGRFLGVDRAYLFLIRNGHCYNDYEWCAEGIEPEKDTLQEMPLSTFDRWISVFEQESGIVVEDVEALRESDPVEFKILWDQGIRRLVAVPLEQDGRLRGFMGVDNPSVERMQSISSLLQTLGYFIMLTYRRSESEIALSHLSYYDTLTSFYNRNRYIEDCETLAGCSGPVGIVYLDVNGLKDINDKHGHAVGDAVLAECARQMREVFAGADFYRIGGDEFVIIYPGVAREPFEEQVAALRQRFALDAQCQAAIGARWNACLEDIQQIIAGADAAMYEDKKEFYRRNPASNRYRHHSDEILRLSDPEVLREEIRQNRFLVYLQPKISSSDCLAVGAEALIRYRPRSGALVLPGSFLPLLEESESVSLIDFYVFEFACSRLKDWADRGKRAFPVSVNFSRCSLTQPDFVRRLTELTQKYGVETRYLEIEITDAARESGGADLTALIRDLRQEGFLVSIDNFGADCLCPDTLPTVEFDVLKLDKRLVGNVARDPKACAVVESMVSLCNQMKIQVVAEGIENEEQLAALRACGVELAQGFLFSRPITAEECEKRYLQEEPVMS